MTFAIRRLWIATLDERCCLECIRLDGMLFDADKVPPAPHPNCRCVQVPAIDDDYTGNRASVFGSLSPAEATLTRSILLRLAESRQAVMNEIESLILSSESSTSLASTLMSFALEETRARPSLMATKTILKGSQANTATIRAVVEACEMNDSLHLVRAWMMRCALPPCKGVDAALMFVTAAQCATRPTSKSFSVQCCEDALTHAAEDYKSLITIGKTLADLGESDRAAKAGTKALELSPNNKAAKSLLTRLGL